MKNIVKLFGIIALVAVIGLALGVTSCGETGTGGTLTVTNGTSGTIHSVRVTSGTGAVNPSGGSLSSSGDLESGKSAKYTFTDDTEVRVNADIRAANGDLIKKFEKLGVTVGKGEDVTVKVE